MSSSGVTYLITGANRGIGLGLLQTLIARPNTTIIAAVRDPAASASTLDKVAVGANSRLVVIKLDASSEIDAASAAEELVSRYAISHIDVLVSNAGIMEPSAILPVLKTPVSAARKHFEVNTLGPLLLVQAFMPLLEKSSFPRFLAITSSIGSMGAMKEYPVPFFAYGMSKAAENYLVRKLALENPNLASIAYNPGWVQTDMGNGAANGVGMEGAPLSLEQSISSVIKLFDEASLENSGSFYAHTGAIIPW